MNSAMSTANDLFGEAYSLSGEEAGEIRHENTGACSRYWRRCSGG